MRFAPVFLVALLFPAQAIAGAQYSAKDVIRYFERLDTATPPSLTSSASDSGNTTPPAEGIVIGGAPAGDRPLAIPMTGAKAGYTVAPVRPAAARAGGYDLMVTFELGSAMLTPQARQNLDAFAAALASPALAKLRFAVEGHTDSLGPHEQNLTLSRARAVSVVSYLVGHGVARDRLTATGYGETRPRLGDPAHPDNRRVETRRID
jgi:outer membrane protein OmpA-like peptidoglycan-associated protein